MPLVEVTLVEGRTPQQLRDLQVKLCLLYTSYAADERSREDSGGRRNIKKKR